MKGKGKPPFLPPDRGDTLRREILSLLRDEEVSAREISQAVGVSEAEVLGHLEHLRLAVKNALLVTPARCLKCGFLFVKRERLKGPGRCPVCRGEHIAEPRFSLR